MKKLILTVVFSILIAAASFHAQIIKWIKPQEKQIKTITLKVVTGDAYKTSSYKDVVANLRFTITTIKGKEIDTVWINEYPAIELNKLSSLTEVFHQIIHLSAINYNEEEIVINYLITYKTNNSILQILNKKHLSKEKSNEQIEINV